MRTSLDIPDSIYRAVKVRAAIEGRTVREILLEGISMRLADRKTPSVEFKLPLVGSTRTDKLDIDNVKINEIIDIF